MITIDEISLNSMKRIVELFHGDFKGGEVQRNARIQIEVRNAITEGFDEILSKGMYDLDSGKQ